MRYVYALLLLLLLLLPTMVHSATTYYVVAGGSGATCSTNPNSAGGNIANAIVNCLSAGDTLYIRAGSYNETLTGFNWPSGNSLNWITIAGYPGETATIEPTGGGSPNVISLVTNGPQYLWFKDLVIADRIRNMSGNILIRTSGATHIRFEQCKILGRLRGSGDPTGTQGFLTDPFHEFIGGEIAYHSVYGIYLAGHDSVVDGVYFHDIGGYGVHAYSGCCDVSNTIVRNSTFVRMGQITDCTFSGGSGCPGAGFIMTSGSNQVAYNNLIVATGIASQDPLHASPGIDIFSSCGSCKFYNNTIVDSNGACIRDQGGGATALNNICYGNFQGITGTSSSQNWPNNQNPSFVDPPNGDFRLNPSSGAIDTGTDLHTIFTTDITGATRQTPWDMGAYDMAASGPSLIPEKGTFFIAPGGTNNSDCHAATGTVDSPSASPFGSYDVARQCMRAESTLYLRAGTYPVYNSSTTPIIGGSSWSLPTILSGFPGETATLQATEGTGTMVFNNPTTDHFIIVTNLVLDAATVTNGVQAIGVNDLRFDTVEVKNTNFEGFYLDGTQNIELRTVTVHDSSVAATGLVGPYNTTNTTITGSTFYNGAGAGIGSYGGNTGLLVEKSTMRNNAGRGVLLTSGDTNPKLYNNLVYSNLYAVHFQSGVSGAQVYYTTGWNNSTACMLFDAGVTGSQVTNNVCWASATLTNNASSGVTLTTNQCTGPTGCTAGDPLFASTTPGNANFLHLCGAAGAPVAGCTGKSPAMDTGTLLPSVGSDFASKARPDGSGVDRGAFEDVPVPVPPVEVGLVPVYRTSHFLLPY